MKQVVEMRGVRKTFVSGWVHRVRKQALKGVDFDVPEGVLWGILGPNGAGKTTLLSILANLLKPEQGLVRPTLGHLGVQVDRSVAAAGTGSLVDAYRHDQIASPRSRGG